MLYYKTLGVFIIKKIGSIIALFILLCACSELSQSFNNGTNTTDSILIDNAIKKDNINLTLSRGLNSENSKIQINNQHLEIFIEEPREAFLVDLDISDTSIELAILANGPRVAHAT